ncbi:MAG: type II secretion system F family protein, partial [archaeon]|nr:type II secretion system F family protein [archaeon]
MAEENKFSRRDERDRKKRFEFDPSKPRDISPGEMYRQIKVPRVEFESEEKAIEKQKLSGYVAFCKGIHKAFPSFGKGAVFTPKYREAVEFLNWPLSAEEYAATSKFVLFASAIIGFIVAIALLLSPIGQAVADYTKLQELSALFIFAPVIVAVIIIVNYVQNYPIGAARIEQYKSLTYVPEIVGYLIMSMKLVPNLEKAVEFAAQHGRGKIAVELQEIIWKVQIGLYSSLAEGLDDLAYRWGKFSVEFKQALMMIRASVLENSDAKRYAVLDRTMDNVLESVRNKMEQYARDLSQPSIILFYLGVLLPLILIIVLPVGSAFSGQPLARPELLILIYNIVIPVVCIIFARNVLQRRPPTYEPPRIPKHSPLVPPAGKIVRGKSLISINLVVIIVLLVGFIASFAISSYGISIPNFSDPKESIVLLSADKNLEKVLKDDGGKDKYFFEEKNDKGTIGTRYAQLISVFKGDKEKALEQLKIEKQQYFIDPTHDVTPYNLIYGSLITLSFAAFVYLYYS